MELSLHLQQKQRQILSQHMQLSVKILQMTSQELEQYLQQASLENPLLELEYDPVEEDTITQRQSKQDWLNALDAGAVYPKRRNDEPESEYPLHKKQTNITLREWLWQQLPGLRLSGAREYLLRLLIDELDENGFLCADLAELAGIHHINPQKLNGALGVLQQLDPAGVGAQDAQQCLLLQAERLTPACPLLCELLRKHFSLLAKNQPKQLAQKTGRSLQEVLQALELLRTLNPKPGNGFMSQTDTIYIRPDVYILDTAAGPNAIFNQKLTAQPSINSYYKGLLQSDPELPTTTVSYICEKLANAEWVCHCLEQRKKTIVRCVETILSWQRPFFERGPGHLKKMSLQDIATPLGLHISTISRAVNGKYLQCKWGAFALNDFFSRSVGSAAQSLSQDNLSQQIQSIIENENKSKPLSDQKISDQLAAAGLSVARRTITKYREQLGIPAASSRKEYS